MTPGNVPPLMNSFQAPVIKEKVAVDDTAQQIVYSVSQGGGLMNRQEDINESERKKRRLAQARDKFRSSVRIHQALHQPGKTADVRIQPAFYQSDTMPKRENLEPPKKV